MARLSPDSIAAAALSVGDREGPKAMSMRRIAAELGCDPMALYRHFPDREALLDAVADRALDGLRLPGAEQPWDRRLAGIFTELRATALRHPGIAGHMASRPPLGHNAQPVFVAIGTALTEAGLSPVDGVRTVQTLIAYLSAAIAMGVRAGAPDARLHQVRDAISALPGAPPGDAVPVVGSDDQFSYGLELLIDGIRARTTVPRGDKR